MNPALLFWLLLLLPFAGFLFLGFSGKKAAAVAGPLACLLTAAGLGLSALLVTSHSGNPPLTFSFGWFWFGETSFRFGFLLDALTATMLLLVYGVALLVQVYSLGYLRDEPARARYFAFLHLFVGAMLLLVVTDNLLVLYGGWELVGLASYLLIGFWYQRPEAAGAAKKAFLMNRIGDVCLLLGVFGVFRETGNFQFPSGTPPVLTAQFSTGTSLLLFGGVIGKSAQFPLHTWLPDAMEGPTPVSALLHAATMVAAGVFLLGRIVPFMPPEALVVVGAVGAVSTVLGAVYALAQTDIKRVLAYSTISQLGLMVLGMGVGAREAALFHLLTHAFFKAGLFLAAGSVIHALHHEQDMRRMGGLRKKLPLTFAAYAVCAAALAGVPLTSGFLSKDALIAESFRWAGEQGRGLAYVLPGAALASAALTAAYLTRQVSLVFFGAFRGETEVLAHVHEPPLSMRLPVLVLAGLSLGWVAWLNPFGGGEVPLWVEIGAGLALLGGAAGAWLNRGKATREVPTFDSFYDRIFVKNTLRLGTAAAWLDRRVVDRAVDWLGILGVVLAHVVAWLDRYFVDGLVNGAAWGAGRFGRLTRSVQAGRVQGYVVAAVLGLLLLVGWVLWGV